MHRHTKEWIKTKGRYSSPASGPSQKKAPRRPGAVRPARRLMGRRAAAPATRAIGVLGEMRRRHPEVNLGIRRAPERRMRAWQVLAGADEEIFRQEHVAMEATGVYWKPVWHILEGRFQQILANAAHIKGVPDARGI